MTVQGNGPATLHVIEPQRHHRLSAGAFCPHHGIQTGDSSLRFHEELRCLLRRRLGNAAFILFGGFGAFLVRDFILSTETFSEPTILFPHIALTVLCGGLAVVLSMRKCLTTKMLRVAELLMFGLSALFFFWLQHVSLCRLAGADVSVEALAYLAQSMIPWIILIQIYGLFIPNAWHRSAAIISMMAFAPLAGVVSSAIQRPDVADVLYEGNFSAMLLWLGIAAVTSIYGSHRLGTMRRQNFDAQKVGVYTLRQKLGEGGMGEVYLAEHRLLKRPCAIKLIRPEKESDPNAIARFESEVQATARLTHMNTVEIYDYGHTDDGTFFYAMEFLPGLNLQELVERCGPLPPERVVYLLRQVCSALSEAHQTNLIHRDIKPGNIFATERGRIYDIAKLLDFGLVKSLKPQAEDMKLTIDGTVVGSPMYAPPERAFGDEDGEVDARGDIYSLGATAYYLLTGQPVFAGNSALKVLFAHVNEIPTSLTEINPHISEELNQVVLKCLEKKPADRYQTAAELEQALNDCTFDTPWTERRAADWWAESLSDSTDDDTTATSQALAATSIAVPG